VGEGKGKKGEEIEGDHRLLLQEIQIGLPFWYRIAREVPDKIQRAINGCSSSTHTHTQPFYGSVDLSGTTRVSRYQKKHSPTTIIVVINHPYLLSPSATTHGILRIVVVVVDLISECEVECNGQYSTQCLQRSFTHVPVRRTSNFINTAIFPKCVLYGKNKHPHSYYLPSICS